jgi:hypothetical protein
MQLFIIFYLYLILHACIARFAVTWNLIFFFKKKLKLNERPILENKDIYPGRSSALCRLHGLDIREGSPDACDM